MEEGKESLSSGAVAQPSPAHVLPRCLYLILVGSLHSIPLHSRVSLLGLGAAPHSTSVHPAGGTLRALSRAPPPSAPPASPCRPRSSWKEACVSDAALGE